MYIFLFFSVLYFVSFPLKGQNYTKLKELSHEKHNSQIFKTNPIVQNKGIELLFRGWHLGYESSVNIKRISTFFSVKYQYRFLSDDSRQEYMKIEFQPRFWTTQLMQNFFIAPAFNVYTTGDLAGGGIFGFQRVMQNRFTFEAWVGIQQTTPLENFQSGAYIRLGANFGFLFWNKY